VFADVDDVEIMPLLELIMLVLPSITVNLKASDHDTRVWSLFSFSKKINEVKQISCSFFIIDEKTVFFRLFYAIYGSSWRSKREGGRGWILCFGDYEKTLLLLLVLRLLFFEGRCV
jgi:hypothetical protein